MVMAATVLDDEAAALSPRELARMLQELDRERRRVEARIAEVVGIAERTVAFAEDGHATVKGWCRALTKCSTGEATGWQRMARLYHAAPEVGAALESGRVGVAQARELARAFANPRCGGQLSAVLGFLVGKADRLSFDEFRQVVARWEHLADEDGAHRGHELSHGNRRASITTHGSTVSIHGHGGTVQGAEMDEIFRRFCDAEFRTDWDQALAEHGDRASPAVLGRTDAQRRWDALHRIFVTAASTPPGAQAPEPVLNLIADLATFERALWAMNPDPGPDPGAGPGPGCDGDPGPPGDPWQRRCETVHGIPVAPADLITAALIGHVRRVVFDSAGVVVDMGRKRRLFTGAARDAVLLASSRCTWPGCVVPSGRCQADHVHEHRHGGVTATSNGAPLCPRHNRWKTSHGYTVTRDPDGTWHTYRPDGTEIA